jgi:hypothetical protein
LLLTFLLAACSPGLPAAGSADPRIAEFNARATLTVSALNTEATQSVLSQQSAATAAAEQETRQALGAEFARATLSAAQTQDAVRLTETAVANAAAAQAASTSTAVVEARATQVAVAEVTGTAIAYNLATATAGVQATQQTKVERQEQLQTYWGWGWKIFGGIVVAAVAILLLSGSLRAFPALLNYLEAKELKERTIRNDRGEIETIILEGNRDLRTMSPNRAFGHGIRNTPDGLLVDRTPDGPEWQNGVISREQLIRLVDAATRHQQNQRRMARRIFREALDGDASGQDPWLSASAGEEEIVDAPNVVVLPPDNQEVREILDDVEAQLLNGES